MSEISSFLALFKPALELTQSIEAIVKEYDDVELKGKINDLMSKLTALQLAYASEVDEKLNLKEEIKALKNKLKTAEDMERKFPGGPYFHLQDTQPYCPTCWDSEFKKIGLGNLNNEYGKCDICDSVIGLIPLAERERAEEMARNSYMNAVNTVNSQSNF